MRDFMPRDGCNFGTELLYWGKRIKILQMRSLDDILSAKRGAAPMMRDYYKKMPGDRKDGWKLRNVPLFLPWCPLSCAHGWIARTTTRKRWMWSR